MNEIRKYNEIVYIFYCSCKVKVSSFSLPSLFTLIFNLSPTECLFFIVFNSSIFLTKLPSASIITSPTLTPAFSAAEKFSIDLTYIPSTKLFFFAVASSKSIPVIPINGLEIFPLLINYL